MGKLAEGKKKNCKRKLRNVPEYSLCVEVGAWFLSTMISRRREISRTQYTYVFFTLEWRLSKRPNVYDDLFISSFIYVMHLRWKGKRHISIVFDVRRRHQMVLNGQVSKSYIGTEIAAATAENWTTQFLPPPLSSMTHPFGLLWSIEESTVSKHLMLWLILPSVRWCKYTWGLIFHIRYTKEFVSIATRRQEVSFRMHDISSVSIWIWK